LTFSSFIDAKKGYYSKYVPVIYFVEGVEIFLQQQVCVQCLTHFEFSYDNYFT